MNSAVDINQIKALKGKYCNSLTTYSRFITREVTIGDIAMGAHHPIRIQSMTTTDTMDTLATVEQTIRMVDAGCEYVRITAPSMKEAQNLAEIKKELRHRGYNVPLIADIHFTPNAAELAARIVEKVRVNPGNYIDKKKFQQIDYTDLEYEQEVERIRKRFSPLVSICKEYGTAMRIGTNHGSLSDRIMSRYGDTPIGMVESAMEFIRICSDLDYHNLVISMKASNPKVMVQAYRMLVEKMVAEGMNYPLHLGVTEAGDGEDGRIKSAVGIGTLLEDGLGDTIRVSLTEEPEYEAPVAKALADRYAKRTHLIDQSASEFIPDVQFPSNFDPYSYQRRKTHEVQNIGGHNVPRVIVDLSQQNLKDPFVLSSIGYNYSAVLDKYNLTEQTADFAYLGDSLPSFSFPGNLKQLYNYSTWKSLKDQQNAHPVFSVEEYINAEERDTQLNFIKAAISVLFESTEQIYNAFIKALSADKTLVLILETNSIHGMAEQRQFIFDLMIQQLDIPVIIKRIYADVSEEDFQLEASTDVGALLTDGLGDGLWIQCDSVSSKVINSTAFGILQATRTRISKTEYISCPSCGRTLFDLQETTQLIRSRTDHLKGIKIGIMGCIVNGPGEMADADYGYVGTGPGVITLYKEKEVVKRNVAAEHAVDELINLIKENGDWVDPVARN
ncbi:(E)-4-hydroxy-3-methylbut-2-enyl-diphosphate synthase [Solitalea canadensis]|uniref:4-hydroxy-3-methylbut-2-en-1-yl diphosphate synthase (flavodoxin) n=1 Tax=Solitalea canadensis (strain ATCC 29591 / DSM 3403 / JCM 21819 / LMG 8368 / NBRC 15130 / NCIMB 12057 / USAM 9D) TaxID=929556 RepID=H8KS51_SOLCM|nr:(E)-4-hydroxy-3-methylbut-2-enyl-diphosphate synthase [Solitalea canadensis]AFD07839.1 1-hydroxy-2-methyl-2-(E)-butenyl 4-diphosphate synthase [Solitalea canadensis DSM 3403]